MESVHTSKFKRVSDTLGSLEHVSGTTNTSYLQFPTHPAFLWFMPRRLISLFTSIHRSYSFQIYFLDCMAQFASPTEIRCLFIALYSDSKPRFTTSELDSETPKNCQIIKHGKLISSDSHQMLPGIFQSITWCYKDIRASHFQEESMLISSVPQHPSCWLHLSASPELTALSSAAVSLPWLCFTHRK